MKKILTLLLIIISFAAGAQSWTTVAGSQRFTGRLGIPVKDTVTGTSADSAQLVIRPADGLLWYKYKGAWVKSSGDMSGYVTKAFVDTISGAKFFTNVLTTIGPDSNAGTINFNFKNAAGESILKGTNDGSIVVGANARTTYPLTVYGNTGLQMQVGNNIAYLPPTVSSAQGTGLKFATVGVVSGDSAEVQILGNSSTVPGANGNALLRIVGNYLNSSTGEFQGAGLNLDFSQANASGGQVNKAIGLLLRPTINNTAGTSIYRGIWYNPTLTSTTGTTNIAFEATTGKMKLGDLAGSGDRMVIAGSDGTLSASTATSELVTVSGAQNITGLKTFDSGLVIGKIGKSGKVSFARAMDGDDATFIGRPSTSEDYEFRMNASGGGGYITFFTNLLEKGRFSPGGNFLLGSPIDDFTNKIQVTGSSNVTGNSYAANFSNLSGKRWVIFGDSFSNDTTYDYVATVKNNLGLIATTNAVAGAQIADMVDTLDARIAANFAYLNLFDIISLHVGVNDFANGSIPLGTINSTVGDGSYAGQLMYFIQTALSNNPSIKMYIITPPEANGAGVAYHGTNSPAGWTLNELSQLIGQICAKYSVQCIDLYALSNLNLQTIPTLLGDGLHPSYPVGTTYMGNIVAQSFLTNSQKGKLPYMPSLDSAYIPYYNGSTFKNSHIKDSVNTVISNGIVTPTGNFTSNLNTTNFGVSQDIYQANNHKHYFRNAANSAYIDALSVNTSNKVSIDAGGVGTVLGGAITVPTTGSFGGDVDITNLSTSAFISLDAASTGLLAGTRLRTDGSIKWIYGMSATAPYRFGIGKATSGTAFTEYLGIDYSTGAVTINSLGTGTVQATSGVLSVSSDGRLKHKLGYFINATDAIMKLAKPQYWKYSAKSKLPEEAQKVKQFGLMADDVHKVLGEQFAPTQKDGYYGLSDRALLGLAIQAIQELKAEIEQLKKKK